MLLPFLSSPLGESEGAIEHVDFTRLQRYGELTNNSTQKKRLKTACRFKPLTLLGDKKCKGTINACYSGYSVIPAFEFLFRRNEWFSSRFGNHYTLKSPKHSRSN